MDSSFEMEVVVLVVVEWMSLVFLCLSFFVAHGWEIVNIVDIVRGSDVAFDGMLRWIMKLNGSRSYFFLKCYSVRNEDGVNIVAVGSARFFALRIGKDDVIDDLIDLLSSFAFFCFFDND